MCSFFPSQITLVVLRCYNNPLKTFRAVREDRIAPIKFTYWLQILQK